MQRFLDVDMPVCTAKLSAKIKIKLIWKSSVIWSNVPYRQYIKMGVLQTLYLRTSTSLLFAYMLGCIPCMRKWSEKQSPKLTIRYGIEWHQVGSKVFMKGAEGSRFHKGRLDVSSHMHVDIQDNFKRFVKIQLGFVHVPSHVAGSRICCSSKANMILVLPAQCAFLKKMELFEILLTIG